MKAGGLLGSASYANVSDCSADVTVIGTPLVVDSSEIFSWAPTKTVPPKAACPEDGQPVGLPEVYLGTTPAWK